MADVPEQLGFYERMLPQRERPMDALGGILNGLGAGFGIIGADLVAALLRHLRHRAARGSASCSRASAAIQSRFAWGFVDRRPRLADRHDARRAPATSRSAPDGGGGAGQGLGRLRAVRARRAASSAASAGCSTGTSRSTCPRAARRRAVRPRRRSPACCTSASATSASARRSPSSASDAEPR